MNKLLTTASVALFASVFHPSVAAEPSYLKSHRVETGRNFACAVMADRRVKCWGSNFYGELGLGDHVNRGEQQSDMGNALPYVDLGVDRVRQLTLGDHHACVLFGRNGVKCWGRNDYGQLGLGDTENRGDGAGEMGTHLPLVLVAPPDVGISSIDAGANHTCAVIEDGSVSCWGYNFDGQLGIGSQQNHGDDWLEFPGDHTVDLGWGADVMQVSAGEDHTCALLDDATVQCWGGNSKGQLGIGNTSTIGDSLLDMGGNLTAVDLDTVDVPVFVVAGGQHSCALFLGGQVKCWGSNLNGELGQGHTDNIGDNSLKTGPFLDFIDFHADYEQAESVTAGSSFNCALASGKVVCWGNNANGELAQGHDLDIGDDPDEMGSESIDADIGSSAVTQVSAGANFACARFGHGRIKCWGYNQYGKLGLGLEHLDTRGKDAEELTEALPYVALGTEVKR